MLFANFAHKRIAILASTESSSAVHIETAFVVIADCSCTCQKHCIANSIGVGFRYINGNLAKQMLFRINDGAIFQSKFFAHLHAHAVLRLVEVGMSAINGNIVLQSLDYRFLHIVASRNTLYVRKNQRMVRNNHIAALGNRFINHFGDNIYANKHSGDFRIGETDIKPCIVVAFLQARRSKTLEFGY